MFTIGKLARRAGVSTDTIRFYERVGLVLPAMKTPSGYRLYTPEALREVAFIKHAQRCGFSLAEIREMHQLSGSPGAASKEACHIAVRKKREIDETILALQSMSQALANLVDLLNNEEDGPAADLPLVQALERQVARNAG